MSIDPKQLAEKMKVIGFKVTEAELQNTIYPIMHDCYELGISLTMIRCHRSSGSASNSGLGTTA
jgi:hypothetical protein